MNGAVQAFTQTELDLISVERIKKLIKTLIKFNENGEDCDSLAVINEHLSMSNESTAICFEHVSMRYREELNWALNDISFEIKSGEHVAIVGKFIFNFFKKIISNKNCI